MISQRKYGLQWQGYLDAVALTEWCSLCGNDRYYWPALRAAGSKYKRNWYYCAGVHWSSAGHSPPFGMRYVPLDQQKEYYEIQK